MFPSTTAANITQCQGLVSAVGPGGSVFLEHGQYLARNGTTVFATANIGSSGCINFMHIGFSPVSTKVQFDLLDLTSLGDTIVVGSSSTGQQSYTIPPRGSVRVAINGPSSGIALTPTRFGYGFAIAGMVITQPSPNIGIAQFDLPKTLPEGSEQTKILMSKAAWDIGYPSPAQDAYDGADNPVMTIAGTLLNPTTGQPKSGTVYLRITDPPDPSPYRGTDAHDDDNMGAAAELVGSGGTGLSTSVQADALGRFEAKLVVKSRVAGDNYQIVASSDANFNCGGTSCARSAVLTLWKRVYMEEKGMFRQGAFISDSAEAGQMLVPVDDPTPFRNLPAGATLELIHAATLLGEGFYFDFVNFDSVISDGRGGWVVHLRTDTPLPRDYGAPPLTVPNPNLSIARDAVGVVQGGTYDVSSVFFAPLFRSMFIDVQPAPQVVAEIPHVHELTTIMAPILGRTWINNGYFINQYVRRASPNCFQRIGASQFQLVQTGVSSWGAELGVTPSAASFNFILTQRIDDLAAGNVFDRNHRRVGTEYNGRNPAVVNGETVDHEAVHFWVHAPAGADGNGHCLSQSYDDPNRECLMHEPYSGIGLDDGHVTLHYANQGSDSEYMDVRKAADPLP